MASSLQPSSAVVHPLVLLSVVDHYNRVARGTKKRVVGVLLGELFISFVSLKQPLQLLDYYYGWYPAPLYTGQVTNGVVNVANSYAGMRYAVVDCFNSYLLLPIPFVRLLFWYKHGHSWTIYLKHICRLYHLQNDSSFWRRRTWSFCLVLGP